MISIEYQKEVSKPELPTVTLKDIPDGAVFTGQTGGYPHRLFMKVKTFASSYEACEYKVPKFILIGLDCQSKYGCDLWDHPDVEIKNYRPVSITIQVLDTAPDF